MNLNYKIEELAIILDFLNQGIDFKVDDFAFQLGINKKIIKTNLKKYIFSLYTCKTINYDYFTKAYKAKSNFLFDTSFSSDELAIISILKNRLNNNSENSSLVFDKKQIEIMSFIENKNFIKSLYMNKDIQIYPLSILDFENNSYLVAFEPLDNKIKVYKLNSLKNIKKSNFEFTDYSKIDDFYEAIKISHRIDIKKLEIRFFVDKKVSKQFLNYPLNDTQNVVKKYPDESMELKVIVSNLIEITSSFQKYIPFIELIELTELKNKNSFLKY